MEVSNLISVCLQELLVQVETILGRPKLAFAHLGVDIDLFASRAQLSIAAKVSATFNLTCIVFSITERTDTSIQCN